MATAIPASLSCDGTSEPSENAHGSQLNLHSQVGLPQYFVSKQYVMLLVQCPSSSQGLDSNVSLCVRTRFLTLLSTGC